MKQQKGITLIALIITIIVMLILVAVTLSIVLGDNGILNKARTGTASQQLEQERETLQAAVLGAYDEVAMEVDFTKLNLPEGFSKIEDGKYKSSTGNVFIVDKYGTITVEAGTVEEDEDSEENPSESESEDESSKIPQDLVAYLLGEDHQGRTLMDSDGNGIWGFNESGTAIVFQSETNFDATNLSLEGAIYIHTRYEENGIDEMIGYCNYEGKTYKFAMEALKTSKGKYYTVPFSESSTIEVAYEADLSSRVGKYILWDSNDDGTDESWRILYDDTTNGLQIICSNTMKYNNQKLYLGGSDTYLTANDSTFAAMDYDEQAMISYNNAISTLNTVCNELITNRTNVTSVRCVGSNPTNPSSESGMCSSTILETYSDYNGKLKADDLNLITDYDRMIGIGTANNADMEEYWMASRYLVYHSCDIFFKVHTSSSNGYDGDYRLFTAGTYDYGDYYSAELRPVVTLNSNVTFSGSGTEADPYTF